MPAGDDSKQTTPGAAFGIPEGVTGEEVVDAVFGGSGVDPELLPYLEAVGSPDPADAESLTVSVSDLQEAGAQQEADAEVQDREDLEALRELVAANMIPGGDPDRLEELLAEVDADDSDDWESWEPQLPDVPEDEHLRELEAAARAVEVSARMREVEAEILSRAPEHQVQPSLERVEAVLDILGNPERTYRTVHITGTNGKTSTARMTERLLAAGGMRTGRFTSPHLATIRERISLDGEPISEEGFIAAWEDVAPYIAMVDERSQAEGGPRLSFFEVLAVMALAAFADHPVDVAIIEVGLGGRWDATNVIDSGVSVITPIALDHTKWLGSTIEEIAREKAGIIKPGQVVVIMAQEEEVLDILLEQARSVDAIARVEGRDFEVVDRQMGVGGQMVTIRTPSAVYEDVFVPLFGEYQAHNAAAALVAVEAFMGGRGLDGRIVEQGLMNASSPGRMQVVRHSPTIIVDAAHNPAGAATLREAVESSFGFARIAGVYAAMGDKDVEGVLSEVEPFIDHLVVTQMPGERAADIARLAEIAEEVFGPDRVDVRESLADAVDRAAAIAEAGAEPADRSGVLVFGSVMLAGEMLALAGHSPR